MTVSFWAVVSLSSASSCAASSRGELPDQS